MWSISPKEPAPVKSPPPHTHTPHTHTHTRSPILLPPTSKRESHERHVPLRFFLFEGRTLRSPEAAAWDKLSAFSTSLMSATAGPEAWRAAGGLGGGGGGAAGIALMVVTFWGKDTMERQGRMGKGTATLENSYAALYTRHSPIQQPYS